MRTRRKPVGVSLTVRNGLGGSGRLADDVAVLGVGVTFPVGVPVGVPLILAAGGVPPGDNPSFMVTISRYPAVIFIFNVRVRNPMLVTVTV
jgi:hypothetical protein